MLGRKVPLLSGYEYYFHNIGICLGIIIVTLSILLVAGWGKEVVLARACCIQSPKCEMLNIKWMD